MYDIEGGRFMTKQNSKIKKDKSMHLICIC